MKFTLRTSLAATALSLSLAALTSLAPQAMAQDAQEAHRH